MGRAKGKLSKGQPRGVRSASGRLRDRAPRIVGPCDGIVRRREEYGAPANDYETFDALGRAWQAGLLDPDVTRAKAMLDAGRSIAAAYWHSYGFETPDSLARFQPRSARAALSEEQQADRDRAREAIVLATIGLIQKMGRDYRRAFDDLVINPNPDSGPLWLDHIILTKRHNRTKEGKDSPQSVSERALATLGLAVAALRAITA